ncbi:MAG: hypothetical protein OXG39_09985 [Chloroflexi bacterium]|nr:hypothetical protein [Chloroflexota bacterium]
MSGWSRSVRRRRCRLDNGARYRRLLASWRRRGGDGLARAALEAGIADCLDTGRDLRTLDPDLGAHVDCLIVQDLRSAAASIEAKDPAEARRLRASADEHAADAADYYAAATGARPEAIN